VLKYLIKKGSKVNCVSGSLGATPLYYACATGNIANVKYLLKRGAKCNKKTKDGLFPLYVSAQNGRLEIVKVLVEHGADISMYWKLPFFTSTRIARKMKHTEVVSYLQSEKAAQKVLSK